MDNAGRNHEKLVENLIKGQSKLKHGTRILLLASYCDNPDCSDIFPCRDCLVMCNVARLQTNVLIDILGGFDYLKGGKQHG